jgi:peptidoglycan-N-acetylglucosamine deacetylase
VKFARYVTKYVTNRRQDVPLEFPRGGYSTSMHRRQVLGLAGAAVAGASTTRWLLGNDETEPEDDEDDEEIEDPRSGLRRLIWTVSTDQPLAALSFDDGPHPYLTPQVLDILDRYGIKATFMAMGYAAERHPRLLSEVVDAGHEVGHHTWRHKNLALTDADTTRAEIERGAKLVEDVAGVPVRLFRPPRGRLSEAAVRLAAKHRHDIVLWSVTRGPLDERSPRRVADHLVKSTGPGDIIDLHDGIGRGTFNPRGDFAAELMDRRLTELAALPRFIEELGAKGVRLGTISDLMATRARTEV